MQVQVCFKTFLGPLRRSNITITDNRDMNTRILLDVAYQGPVGFTGVHLGTSATMNGQRLDTTIL